MKRYGNQNGGSSVLFYEDGPDFIKVQFRGGNHDVYVYDYVVPGRNEVERMKMLAAAGSGLSTYISQHVRERYHRKELAPLRLL